MSTANHSSFHIDITEKSGLVRWATMGASKTSILLGGREGLCIVVESGLPWFFYPCWLKMDACMLLDTGSCSTAVGWIIPVMICMVELVVCQPTWCEMNGARPEHNILLQSNRGPNHMIECLKCMANLLRRLLRILTLATVSIRQLRYVRDLSDVTEIDWVGFMFQLLFIEKQGKIKLSLQNQPRISLSRFK